MDYTEAFKNLRTNNKYGRKSPHKAVLMLTVIELFEQNELSDNEIYYDDKLKSMFLKVWNRVLPEEPLFHPDAYLPFWYLQSDSFWHIVPVRGKEDILSLMRDTNVKPSETKLYDCVKYAELDEDLYFLMTLPSGRSSLKRVLLETYTNLSDIQIEKLAFSADNAIDYSTTALSDYERIISENKGEAEKNPTVVNNEAFLDFNMLNEDVKIALNLEYYTFLKNHRGERELFKEICPTVYDLYHNIVNHPIKQGEVTPTLAFIYENFLSDLKISLMSEDYSMDLIDRIGEAIAILRGNYKFEENTTKDVESEKSEISDNKEQETTHDTDIESTLSELEIENVYLDSHGKTDSSRVSIPDIIPEKDFVKEDRKGKPWTQNEEELITLYFNQGKDAATIADIVGRTEVSIKMRLAKLGLIEYTYKQGDSLSTVPTNNFEDNGDKEDFKIENSLVACSIYNKKDEKVFSAEGKLKYINGNLYRFNHKRECFTVKEMLLDGDKWIKGTKKIVAYPQSDLYILIDRAYDYCDVIEDIVDSPIFSECKLKIKGVWYDNTGNSLEDKEPKEHNLLKRIKNKVSGILHSDFTPKGKLKDIPSIATSSYDYMWMMSLVEFMQLKPQPSIISFDRMACMTIAIAWEIINEDETAREKEGSMVKCIEHLIEESKIEMGESLEWKSSRKIIFRAIKDYPMAGAFEDLVDELLEKSPYNVLRAWFPNESDNEVIGHSASFEKSCLYAIHPDKRDPYLEINNNWMKYLFYEHDKLMSYFKQYYLDYIEGK